MIQSENFQLPITLYLPQYSDYNTKLFITGNVTSLGNWVNSKAKPLEMKAPGLWSTIIKIDHSINEIEWKYMEIQQKGPETHVIWQDGYNNKLTSFSISRFIFYNQYKLEQIKILSFNIRYSNDNDNPNQWKNRKNAVTDIIQKSDSDFIGLQEVLKVQGEDICKEVGFQYGYLGRGRDKNPDKGEASPILYNKFLWVPIFDQTFWLSKTPLEPSMCFSSNLPRIATIAIFCNNYEANYQVLVVNTHFDLDQVCREKSVNVILKLLEDILLNYKIDEIIMMGDFNSQKGSPEIQKLIDNLKFKQFPYQNQTTFHDFLGADYRHTQIIDHVFYSGKQFKLKSYEVDTKRPEFLKDPKVHPSDHYPIVCILQKLSGT